MTEEERIKQDLSARFGLPEESVRIQRSRRLYLEVDYGTFSGIFDYAVKQLNFSHLCTITGLDEGESLAFIYHLSGDSGILLNLKTNVPKSNPELKTVTPYFKGAEIYEREVADLLGAKIQGLPAGNRYPLTDEWPLGEFPLRKDWKPKSENESGGQ